jgi:hypothetical protein
MIISVYWSSRISSQYSTHIWMKLEFFSTHLRKMLKYEISWKSIQCEPSCSMRRGGRTDKTKVIVTFRNFVNAPKTPYVLKLKRKVVEGTRQWQRARCRKYKSKEGIPGAVASVTLGCKQKLTQKGLHRSLFVSYHLKIQGKGDVRFITSNWQSVTKYFYTLKR